jgi:hypothetical protein
MPRPRGDLTTPTSIRLPPALYEELDKARGRRPRGEEIRRRLEASFATAGPVIDHPRFRDIMGAIGQAAMAAIQMAGDDSPYGYFAAAVPFLLAMFQPADCPRLEDDWLAMVIAGDALVAMRKTELLSRLKEIAKRGYDSSGKRRQRDPLLYPQDYEAEAKL